MIYFMDAARATAYTLKRFNQNLELTDAEYRSLYALMQAGYTWLTRFRSGSIFAHMELPINLDQVWLSNDMRKLASNDLYPFINTSDEPIHVNSLLIGANRPAEDVHFDNTRAII